MCREGIQVTGELDRVEDLSGWLNHLVEKGIKCFIVKSKGVFSLWRVMLPSDATFSGANGKSLKAMRMPTNSKIISEY